MPEKVPSLGSIFQEQPTVSKEKVRPTIKIEKKGKPIEDDELHFSPVEGLSPKQEQHARKVAQRIVGSVENEDEAIFLGAGRMAKVLTHENFDGTCLKRLHTIEELGLMPDLPTAHRSPNQEAELQNQARAILSDSKDGMVHLGSKDKPSRMMVPAAVGVVAVGGRRYIQMETVSGSSIQDVSAGKSSLPKGFNFEAFAREVRAMIKELNDNGFYHRDIHGGNIMIDKKGRPVVIDFGTSKKTDNSKSAYKDVVMIDGKESVRHFGREKVDIRAIETVLGILSNLAGSTK